MASINFKPIDLLGKQVSFTYKAFDESIVEVEGLVTHVVLSLDDKDEFCVQDRYYSLCELISFQVL